MLPIHHMPDAGKTRLLRWLVLLAMVLLLLGLRQPIQAEEWMYRRSYFSHTPVDGESPAHPLPESRSAYRTAYYQQNAGFAVRSGYRINNYVIQNGGRIDRTIYREGWVEVLP